MISCVVLAINQLTYMNHAIHNISKNINYNIGGYLNFANYNIGTLGLQQEATRTAVGSPATPVVKRIAEFPLVDERLTKRQMTNIDTVSTSEVLSSEQVIAICKKRIEDKDYRSAIYIIKNNKIGRAHV